MNDSPRPKRHLLRWLLTSLGVFLACGTLGYGCFVPRLSVHQFRHQVAADLPIGTPRKQVEAWLQSRGLVFFGMKQIGNDREVGIGGWIGGTGPALDPNEKISFEFYFDTDDKLERFTARSSTTSL